jgi:aspartyl-tRNA(Asn)/glutamyl-tRNA(Gln) amidotransferase subunit A
VLDENEILDKAKEADSRIANKTKKSKIDGIPYALKDNMCTKGIATTCASKILENFIPPYDCTVYEHLSNAGGVLIGKCDMDEFAMGSTTENSALGSTKNPWNINKEPGGSSGGSAAVVSSGQAIFALGSDTGAQ